MAVKRRGAAATPKGARRKTAASSAAARAPPRRGTKKTAADPPPSREEEEEESGSSEEEEETTTSSSSAGEEDGEGSSSSEEDEDGKGDDGDSDDGSSESSSSEEEEQSSAGKKPAKMRATDVRKKKVESSSSSDDSDSDGGDDDDDDSPEKTKVKGGRATAVGKEAESSSFDDDDDESESDDDEDDDDAPETKKEEKGGKAGGGAFFTDENADWLKPKRKRSGDSEGEKKSKLLSSSDEDGDESDDEEMLEVERQSRLIDAEMEAERLEAEAEMDRTIAQRTSVYHLPTPEELEDEEDRVVPPSELRDRIGSVLEVLSDFKNRREEGRSRTEYVDRLGADLAELHGYLPELIEHFLSMLGPAETAEFVEASERPRPLVVRTNTLKARRKDLASSLMKRGVTLDPLAPWSKVGLKILESPVPIGATPEYLGGHYMLQSAASMCPVLALDPKPNERILDVSAAPGGKTSYVAQLMRNTGTIVANDLKPDRQKATVANLHRLGVRNVVTTACDGRKLGPRFRNRFHRVLLDAPCSGLGVVSRDPSVKVRRTMADVTRCGHLQKELLLAAIDACDHRRQKDGEGGVVVYSTCSVSVAENEEVVNYALGKRDVRVVDAGLDFGKPGFTRYQHKRFHPSLALTRRFYPHVHNMDGFYVCKLRKLSDGPPGGGKKEEEGKGVKAAGDEVPASVAEEGDSGVPADVDDEKGRTTPSEKHEKDGDQKTANADDAKDDGRKGFGKKGRGKRRPTKGKKRGAVAEDADGASKRSKKRGGRHASVPPALQPDSQKAKKKRTNAKVSKPRRRKVVVGSTGSDA